MIQFGVLCTLDKTDKAGDCSCGTLALHIGLDMLLLPGDRGIYLIALATFHASTTSSTDDICLMSSGWLFSRAMLRALPTACLICRASVCCVSASFLSTASVLLSSLGREKSGMVGGKGIHTWRPFMMCSAKVDTSASVMCPSARSMNCFQILRRAGMSRSG